MAWVSLWRTRLGCILPVMVQLAANPATITGITIAACDASQASDIPIAKTAATAETTDGELDDRDPGVKAAFHVSVHTPRERADRGEIRHSRACCHGTVSIDTRSRGPRTVEAVTDATALPDPAAMPTATRSIGSVSTTASPS